jgi:hypothetical protein
MCADISMIFGALFFLLVVAVVGSTAVFLVVILIAKWLQERMGRPAEAEAR